MIIADKGFPVIFRSDVLYVLNNLFQGSAVEELAFSLDKIFNKNLV